MHDPTDAERDAIAAQIRDDSRELHARLRDVSAGSLAPRTLLRAVENTITATGERILNVYGTNALAMAFARISSAASTAKRAGDGLAGEARELIRIAYAAELKHREVRGGSDELAGRRAFDLHADAREMRSWYELTWRERRDWIDTAGREGGQ
ncbi:hypothetical protein [Rhodococcoides fascians]|uniref:hypothetical protein n=1 Tax=Rhodococcoides fascians TaxID=1828 RepID=UPI000AB4B821|nr:hypothetical protein [Rhodococcus fascians]